MGLFSGRRTVKLDGLKTGGLSLMSRIEIVSGTLLFKPPTSSPSRNSSTRGTEKASRSRIAPPRTDTTPGDRERERGGEKDNVSRVGGVLDYKKLSGCIGSGATVIMYI